MLCVAIGPPGFSQGASPDLGVAVIVFAWILSSS